MKAQKLSPIVMPVRNEALAKVYAGKLIVGLVDMKDLNVSFSDTIKIF